MKKIFAGALIASSLAGITPVHAQPSSFPFTISGNFIGSIGYGPTLNCIISVKITSSSNAEFIFVPVDPGCATITTKSISHAVDFVSGAWPQDFTIEEVDFLDITLSTICKFDIEFTYDVNGFWEFSEARLGPPPCNFYGYVL